LGLTIPFPGCLSGALVCAESAKKHFGAGVSTVARGGYINTELRSLNDPRFNNYFDHVSLDRAYGFLASILDDPEHITHNIENEAVWTVFPDYSSVDFSRYIYPVDDTNPMHRLWSDGHWLKAYLAHGCYWHSCAFCDVSLDYIKNFIPVDVPAFFAHMKNQAEKTGVSGIHLVDEAAPVSSLLESALLNRETGLPLNFWGNIRFEKEFTPDLAAILAAGGLTGVSAGLEVATESGFKRLGKGIDLESAVRANAAFKEAGILTHAYLIYGYWDEDEQELIDSAEVLRQFFALGLLDSAFWHKFVLTCHSRIYAEKQRGLHPALKIKDDPAGVKINGGESGEKKPGAIFARNDLSFEGEEKSDKYTEALENLTRVWMKGQTETPVTKAFPVKVKAPSVPPDLVEGLLGNYMAARDNEREIIPNFPAQRRGDAEEEDNVLFLGSAPRPRREGKNLFLVWRWRLEERRLECDPGGTSCCLGSTKDIEELIGLIEAASLGRGLAAMDFYSSLEKIAGSELAKTIWTQLRENGLALYHPAATPQHKPQSAHHNP